MTPTPNQESFLGNEIPKKMDILDYAERRFTLNEKGIVEVQGNLFEEVQQTNSSEVIEKTSTERIQEEVYGLMDQRDELRNNRRKEKWVMR